MKTTCLINNYNYSQFVVEAVNSALNQTIAFDEIIIVDDGSTDDSLDIIREHFSKNDKVKLIAKENQGQLSCFCEGFRAATGDLIFFLDADDVYTEDYLKEALEFYERNPLCDFLFCGRIEFGRVERTKLPYAKSHDFGSSMVLTFYLQKWIGGPTSTISIRRHIMNKIFPISTIYYDDWKTRADDCLVYGASLCGARKYYLARPLIRYRVHGNNNWWGKRFDYMVKLQRKIAINRLFAYFMYKYQGFQWEMRHLAKLEFRTIPQPSWAELRLYIKIVIGSSKLCMMKKLEIIGVMAGYYLHKKLNAQASL